MRVVSLFSGIGGLDACGTPILFCENDPAARAVLRAHYPDVPLHTDVCTLESLPACDVLTAGFPCQDLSQAGRTAGIAGAKSSLVGHVFRLLDRTAHGPAGGPAHGPRYVLLENVPNLLYLDRGRAMTYLTRAFSRRGYSWAYRIVDTRAWGLPQRRRRVVFLASRTGDPRRVLFAGNAPAPEKDRTMPAHLACGFSWTEGRTGLGWAVDAVPTIRGGSGVGIPSPPAIVLKDRTIITPDIRDAERLQGFPEDWTAAAPTRDRWRLVGNAVSVPVARWVGARMRDPGRVRVGPRLRDKWPRAAYRMVGGQVRSADVSEWPTRRAYCLGAFLHYPGRPLSLRAARGFRNRTRRSTLRFPVGFLDVVDRHMRAQGPPVVP